MCDCNKQTVAIIDEEYVQEEAQTVLKRELNEYELDEVGEKIREGVWLLVRESIDAVLEFNELVERNKTAINHEPRYELYWRNEGAYQKEFKLIQAFFSERDAKLYSRTAEIGNSENEWKIVPVGKR